MKRILLLLPFLVLLLLLELPSNTKAQTSCPIFNVVNPSNPTDIDTIALSFNNNGQGSYSVKIDNDNNKIFRIFPPYSSVTIGSHGVGNHSFQVFVDVIGGTPPSCSKLSFDVIKAQAGATPVTPTPTVAACASRCNGNSNCTFCPNGGVLCGTTNPAECSANANPAPTPTVDLKQCPICDSGWIWNYPLGTCQDISSKKNAYKNPALKDCSSAGFCAKGCGCDETCLGDPDPNAPPPPCAKLSPDGKQCLEVTTAIGNIGTSPEKFIGSVFSLLLGISGGIALILIITSGYKLMASQGEAEAAKEAREMLTSAIVGLLFIIFSFVILQIIGVTILKIPGFSP